MDEYLSEKEQIELIKQWWRENGWYLLGGAAIAGLAYFGWNQYVAYENGRAEQAAGLYLDLQETLADDRPGADDILAELVADYADSPYLDQARLLIASDSLISDPARAVDELRAVMESSEDPGLAMVARLRLARVLAYRERYDEALDVLAVEDPGSFAAWLNEILGDVHVGRGDLDAARRAYSVALAAEGAETLDQNLLQMKLGSLARPEPDSEVPVAGEPEAGGEAAPAAAPESPAEGRAAAGPEAASAPAEAAAGAADQEGESE